jgi:hypothetical protein
MRKPSRESIARFKDRFDAIVNQHRGEVSDNHYKYMLHTKYGKLYITIHSEDVETVFTKFDEPGKAKDAFNCNQLNGKYNFHYNNSEYCLDQFELFLNKVN